jgi:hypothetical protein
MDHRFILNGKTYSTDGDTVVLLEDVIHSARKTGDFSAVMAIMFLGLHTGRIIES